MRGGSRRRHRLVFINVASWWCSAHTLRSKWFVLSVFGVSITVFFVPTGAVWSMWFFIGVIFLAYESRWSIIVAHVPSFSADSAITREAMCYYATAVEFDLVSSWKRYERLGVGCDVMRDPLSSQSEQQRFLTNI